MVGSRPRAPPPSEGHDSLIIQVLGSAVDLLWVLGRRSSSARAVVGRLCVSKGVSGGSPAPQARSIIVTVSVRLSIRVAKPNMNEVFLKGFVVMKCFWSFWKKVPARAETANERAIAGAVHGERGGEGGMRGEDFQKPKEIRKDSTIVRG